MNNIELNTALLNMGYRYMGVQKINLMYGVSQLGILF